MELGRGDLTPDEVVEMAEIQILLEATELGKKIEYSDTLKRGCLDLEIMVNDADPIQIMQEYEKRLKTFIVQPEKYNRVKEKVPITSYELFVFKAIMLSLDMVSYFDVENACTKGWDLSLIVKQMTDLEYYDTPLALESECNCGEGALLTTIVNPALGAVDPKSYNTIQYLTIYIQDQNCNVNSLFERVFPNVKYLRLVFDKDFYWYQGFTSRSDTGSMLVDLLKKQTFPKLIHLSVRGLQTPSNLFEIEILDQLLYFDITGNDRDSNNNRNSTWSGENGLNSLYPKLLTDNNLMHHLILQGIIHHYWPQDVTKEILEQYYNSTKDHFVASLSHSSINHYYLNCNE